MPFFDRLQRETTPARDEFMSIPIIQDCMAGRVRLNQYLAFLEQAYHHVKHTLPLLMACGAHLGPKQGCLLPAIADYIEEERGHEEWILNDISACGGDADFVRRGEPAPDTELMVAYAYDAIARKNPVSFFGMVHVLEGTSAAIATDAASIIAQRLNLPAQAFTYLSSHGSLDVEHVQFFAGLMNRLEYEADQRAVVHGANMMYRLYGNIFRALPRQSNEAEKFAA